MEWDRRACETLRANAGRSSRWGADEIYECDAGQVNYAKFMRVDLLAGGVPCQPFSLGGAHRGHVDRRNQFPVFLEAVRATRPRAILVENVPGLLRPAFRPYFEYILDQLRLPDILPRRGERWLTHHQRIRRDLLRRDPEYSVEWRRVNAADYGAPQYRVRVLIQAVQSTTDQQCTWPTPTHSAAQLQEDLASGAYGAEHGLVSPRSSARYHRLALPLPGRKCGVLKRWVTVRDALVGLTPPGSSHVGPPSDHVEILGARVYPGHTGSLLDGPAKTLKAGVHGVPGGEATLVLDDGSVRYFSVREAARLQGFPDDFLFVGSRTEKMRQIGNAVPVQLATAVGLTISAALTRDLAPGRSPDRRYPQPRRDVSLALSPG